MIKVVQKVYAVNILSKKAMRKGFPKAPVKASKRATISLGGLIVKDLGLWNRYKIIKKNYVTHKGGKL